MIAVMAGCSFQVVSYVRGILDDRYSTNVLSSDVRVHFDCAGSHKWVSQRSLAQPSRHFGHLRSLSLWRGVNFAIALFVARCSFLIVKKILRRDLDKKVFDRLLAQRSCHGGFL